MNAKQESFLSTEIKELNFIKTNLRPKRTFIFYCKFWIYLFPAFFVLLGLIIFYFGRIVPHTGEHIGNFLPVLTTTFGITIFIFIFNKMKETEIFQVIPITKFDIILMEQEISKSFPIEKMALDSTLHVLNAKTKNRLFSKGENITIIRHDEKLLINSKPFHLIQPITILKDKKNIEKIKEIIERTCC